MKILSISNNICFLRLTCTNEKKKNTSCTKNELQYFVSKIFSIIWKNRYICQKKDIIQHSYFFQIEVPVNHLDITKQPNQKQYDTKTFNITLTCKGNGNPQPTYTWFKEGEYNTILSNQSFYVIENVIEDNSGVYICEVYNIIEDIRYRKSNSVEINIGELTIVCVCHKDH